jgi:hypothetical protein
MRTLKIARKHRVSDGASSKIPYPPAPSMVGFGPGAVIEVRRSGATAEAMASSVEVAL